MTRTLALLGAYVLRFTLEWSAGRSFLVTLVANQAVGPLVSLAVWSAALPGRSDVSAYFVALLLTRLVTVSYENHTFANRIYGGEIVDDLLRPHAVVIAPLGENLAVRVWHLGLGVPLVLLALLLAGVAWQPANLALFVPAVLLAAALRFVVTFTLSLAALWGGRAHGLVSLGDTLIFLLGGGAFPVALLPGPWRDVLGSLPFWAMNGWPAEVLSGTPSTGFWWGLGGQVAWLGVALLVLRGVWRAGLRRYASVGG